VEQKNWSFVRHLVGYERWGIPEKLGLLASSDANLRLHVKSFQPELMRMGKFKLAAKPLTSMFTPQHLIVAFSPWGR